MRSILLLVLIIGLGLLALVWFGSRQVAEERITGQLTSENMQLTSTAFSNGGIIPTTYTCDGENINPPLTITNVPDQAISLVLIMEDPDVPAALRPDQMFDHWVLYNLPSDTAGIGEAGVVGSAGKNTRGDAAYTGPCPPGDYQPTEHRYFFRLYAVDTMFNFTETPSKTDVLQAIEGHVLAEAELMGRYERPVNE